VGRYSKDRHEYNNKIQGTSDSCDGLGIFIQVIVIFFACLIYGIYYLYKKYYKKQ